MDPEGVERRLIYCWQLEPSRSLLRLADGKLFESGNDVDYVVQSLADLSTPLGLKLPPRMKIPVDQRRPVQLVCSSEISTQLSLFPSDVLERTIDVQELKERALAALQFAEEPKPRRSVPPTVLWISLVPSEQEGLQAETCARTLGCPFVSVELRYPDLFIAPSPSGHVYQDLSRRRLALSQIPRLAPILSSPPTRRPPASAFADMLGTLQLDCDQQPRAQLVRQHSFLTGETVDSIAVPWMYNPVLPVLEASLGDFDELVNADHGVISRLRLISHDPMIPLAVKTVQSHAGNTVRISRWTNNDTCQGSTIDDVESSRYAAIGEAVERYCVNVCDTLPIFEGSYTQLSEEHLLVDPEAFVLFSDEQYHSPGFPFVPFHRDLSIPWVEGRRLSDDKPILVPFSMVYVNTHSFPHKGIPRIDSIPYTGVAAGPNKNFAIKSALQEIAERHATMLWWHSKPCIDRYEIQGSFQAIKTGAESLGFRVSTFVLPNEMRLPVVAAALEDPQNKIVNIGFACRDTIDRAACKAITEAFTLHDGSLDMLSPTSILMAACANGLFNSSSVRTQRVDRQYLDSYAEDFSDVSDLMMQQQINLDPRCSKWRNPYLHRGVRTALQFSVFELSDDTMPSYLKRFSAIGVDPIVVDITTPDLGRMGGRVVRVLCPGLIPNFAAGHIHLGRDAIRSGYVNMGLLKTQDEIELNHFPLPHA